MITIFAGFDIMPVRPLPTIEFGDWLRAARKKRKLSTVALGKLAGISHVTIGNIEQDRKGYSWPTVKMLIDALVSLEQTDDAKEQLRLEARAASAGIDLIELQREPDDEYLKEAIVNYDGNDPALKAFRGFLLADSVARVIPPEEDWIEAVDGPRPLKP